MYVSSFYVVGVFITKPFVVIGTIRAGTALQHDGLSDSTFFN